jgi:hypothetical protein
MFLAGFLVLETSKSCQSLIAFVIKNRELAALSGDFRLYENFLPVETDPLKNVIFSCGGARVVSWGSKKGFFQRGGLEGFRLQNKSKSMRVLSSEDFDGTRQWKSRTDKTRDIFPGITPVKIS